MSRQITLTLNNDAQHQALRRCAKKWADEFLPGGMKQPVSSYLRWLWAESMKSEPQRGY